MSISKKSPEEIEILREGGKILARILRELGGYVRPGITTEDLDDRAQALAEEYDVEPVLLGYKPAFAAMPYPAAICTSVNDVVQHGIPAPDEVLQDGDIIDIDMSIGHERMVVDAGITVGVGEIDADSRKLIEVTREALAKGVAAARAGNHIGDIGHAVQSFVESRGLAVVKDLCGHGVGHAVHEEPSIPNFGKPGTGPLIEVGHVYAIEPIVNLGSHRVVFDDTGDGYAVRTADGSRSAHFEHTVVVTDKGPLILTN